MDRTSLAAALGVLAATWFGNLVQADELSVDYPALVSRADLTIEHPVSRSEEGLPIGNGRMGTLLWTEGDTLGCKLTASMCSATVVSAAASRNATATIAAAADSWISISANPSADRKASVFTADHCKQHLSCYDGMATIEGNGVKVEAQAWKEQDVIALQISDDRPAKNGDTDLDRCAHVAAAACEAFQPYRHFLV